MNRLNFKLIITVGLIFTMIFTLYRTDQIEVCLMNFQTPFSRKRSVILSFQFTSACTLESFVIQF